MQIEPNGGRVGVSWDHPSFFEEIIYADKKKSNSIYPEGKSHYQKNGGFFFLKFREISC